MKPKQTKRIFINTSKKNSTRPTNTMMMMVNFDMLLSTQILLQYYLREIVFKAVRKNIVLLII